jgi:hypothetical protein
MQLPLGLPLGQMQTRWKSLLDPVLSNELNSIIILKDVSLKSGSNVINHLLGQNQAGWIITDIQGSASVYRSAPFNDKTLTLTSSANVVVSIGVY